MNEAIQRGAAANIGYGEALARYIDEHPDRFPYKDDCVLYQAYRMDIPATYHIALGTDIIHQHPSVDFAAIGKASGIDFHKMWLFRGPSGQGRVHELRLRRDRPGGVPEGAVHLPKSGLPTFEHYHRPNFDLIDLGDYGRRIGYENPQYYYRPRKNIVNRP